MPPLTLRVFISSPGDVGQERILATRVLERLQGEFSRVVTLEPLLWEHEPLRATGHFQEQIPPPSQADIMVCILWSRLGTRLPAQFHRADGTTYASGTEWEFEDAVASFRERGRPALLVYRKNAEPLAGPADEAALLERMRQKKALDGFFDRWFGNPSESFKAAFHQFSSADEFEEVLETHLRKVIVEFLPAHQADDAEASIPVRWYKGSPYRGLEAFDVEHAEVFFGRTRAITDVKNALIRQAADGCPFVVIFGMSGGGKSSLVRAGVLPTISQPGVIEGIGLWRRSQFRPSSATGDLFQGLALALLGSDGLPELEEEGLDWQALATMLQEAPQDVAAPLGAALNRASEAVAEREGLARLPAARLVLFIDQMEEMFTIEHLSDQAREGFVAALAALAQSGLVWVLATMRSDFYPRCPEIPDLVTLKDGAGQYDLLPPTAAEIAQMIRYPTRAAGLRFEIEPRTGERLDDVLHAAAASDPTALPLLEFTLDELFNQRTEDDILTFAAYERLGGLEGALAQRAEEVFATLDPAVQAALPTVLRALVTLGKGDDLHVASRRVPMARLAVSPESRALVEAFIGARLLVTDRADDGQPVVGVAHEALLRHWPRLREWLEGDQEFLHTRDRVAEWAERWRSHNRERDLLLPKGRLLDEAKEVLRPRQADLGADTLAFLEESQRAEGRSRRRRVAAITAVATLILGFSIFSFFQWRTAEQRRRLMVQTVATVTNDAPADTLSLPDAVRVPFLEATYLRNLKLLDQVPEGQKSLNIVRAKIVNQQRLAEIWLWQGKQQKALITMQECVTAGRSLADDSREPHDRWNLAVYYNTLGDVYRGELKLAEALKAYQESIRIDMPYAGDLPNGDVQRSLCYSYLLATLCQIDLEKMPAALADHKRGLTFTARLAREPPKQQDPQGRRRLVYNYVALGDSFDMHGEKEAALQAYEGALSLARTMDKGNAQFRQMLQQVAEQSAALKKELASGQAAAVAARTSPAGEPLPAR
jgi:tetratricopeptide (TPR) repeat protein